MKPTLIYCYDAYCGWCYGFSEVMKKINSEYKNKIEVEVLSGGMILPEEPVHIGATADFISKAYKNVEELTGIKFGEDYLWHINHPDISDWYPNSEKPAIALCIFKEYFPDQQVNFAADLQYALHYEGRDITDNEAYRNILGKYNFPAEDFYGMLHEEAYKEKAYYEFALCKQLQVTGFPAVLLQKNESKFHLLARGYTDFETLSKRLDNAINDGSSS